MGLERVHQPLICMVGSTEAFEPPLQGLSICSFLRVHHEDVGGFALSSQPHSGDLWGELVMDVGVCLYPHDTMRMMV